MIRGWSAGTYTLKSLSVGFGGTIDIDNAAGPVLVYIKYGLTFSGFMTRTAEVPNVLFGAAGTGDVWLKKAFTGIVVAPNAEIILDKPYTGEHRGSFFGKKVWLKDHGKVRHEPWEPGKFCGIYDTCSSFCPCGDGAFPCESEDQCSPGLECGDDGVCACVPDCTNASCGGDTANGCGSFCTGVCDDGEVGCGTDLECGPGSVCIIGGGPQKGGEAGTNVCLPAICRELDPHQPDCGVGDADCGPCPACIPDCEGKICGDDGCGGECGSTPDGASCIGGGLVGGWSREAGHSDAFPPPLVSQPPPNDELLPGTEDRVAGTLPGHFAVSDRGLATYTIPLDVPPGRAGMQPSLALAYTSTKARGILGQGWALAGLSTIERCSATIAQDGHTDPVRLDDSDAFCLDGVRLFETTSANSMEGGTAYRTELESFRHIEAFTGVFPELGPTRFKVWQKDGTIFHYGAMQFRLGNYIRAEGGTIRVFALSRIEDRIGNVIDFEYEAKARYIHDPETEASTTELLPLSVRWGGLFRDGSEIAPHDREVVFEYERLDEPRHAYVLGELAHATARIASMRMRVIRDGNFRLHSRYELGYSAPDGDVPDLLRWVRRCGREGGVERCMSATQFDYEAGEDAEAKVQPLILPSDVTLNPYQPLSVTVLDMDGDGLQELIMAPDPYGEALPGKDVVVIRAAQGNQQQQRFVPSTLVDLDADAAQSILGTFQTGGFQVMDLNGDGRDDLISNAIVPTTVPLTSLGADFQVGEPYLTIGGFLQGPSARYADFDGDGLQDLLACVEGEATLYKNTGGIPVFDHLAPFPLPEEACENIQILDVDADGDQDILRFNWPTIGRTDFIGGGPPTVLVDPFSMPRWEDARFSDALNLPFRACSSDRYAFGSENPFFCGNPNVGVDPAITDHIGALTSTKVRLIDANGDGLSDLFDTRAFLLWLNTGNGFVATNPRVEIDGATATKAQRDAWLAYMNGQRSDEVVIHDCDGDGRDDILLPKDELCLRSSARHSFEARPVEGGAMLAKDRGTTVLADTNGDGNQEVIRIYIENDILWAAYLEPNHATRGFLSRVTDGLGRRFDVSYHAEIVDPAAPVGTTRERVYTVSPRAAIEPGETMSTVRVKQPGPLVDRHVESLVDRATGETKREGTFDYRYSNAQAGLGGRGGYGFARRTVRMLSDTLEAQNFTTIVYLNEVFWSAGLVRSIVQRSNESSGGVYSQSHVQQTFTQNDWELRETAASERPFVWLAGSDTTAQEFTGFDAAIVVSRTTSTFQPDEFGNAAEVQTTTTSRGLDEQTEVMTDFTSNPAGFWLHFSPGQVETRHSRGGSFRRREVHYHYDANGLLSQIVRGPNDYETLTTTFDRDGDPSFMNVLEIRSQSSFAHGPIGETRRQSFEYDAAGMFPIKIINQENQTTEVQYDDITGNLLTSMDSNGVFTQFRYDAFGRRRVVNAPRRKVSYSYFGAEKEVGVPFVNETWGAFRVRAQNDDGGTSPDHGFSETTVDARGRTVAQRSLGLFETVVEAEKSYDWLGRTLVSTTPHAAGDTTQGASFYLYDPSGPLSTVIAPDGRQTHFERFSFQSVKDDTSLFGADSAAYGTVAFTPGDLVRFSATDALGLPVQVTEVDTAMNEGIEFPLSGPGVATTFYSYGHFNQLTSIVDPDGHTTTMQYDQLGRREFVNNSATGPVQTRYNGFDEPVSIIDGADVNRCMQYDSLGRLRQLGLGGHDLGDCDDAMSPENLIATWDYDGQPGDNAVGQLVLSSRRQNPESSDFVETEYRYEPSAGRNAARLKEIERRVPGLDDPMITRFSYDGPRLSSIRYPAPQNATTFDVHYDYDGAGNIMAALDETGNPYWAITKASQGQRLREETFGNGVETEYVHAGPDTCTGSDSCIPGVLTRQQSRLSGEVLKDVRYQYDVAGNVSSRLRSGGPTEDFAYDGFNRLEAYAKHLVNGDMETREYSYSAGGNILGYVTQLNDTAPQFRVYDYDGHRVTAAGGETYSYTASGNQRIRNLLREAPGAPPGTVFEATTQTLFYNEFNMPWRVGIVDDNNDGFDVQIDYDAAQRRVAKRGPENTTIYAGELYECRGTTPSSSDGMTCDKHLFKVFAGANLVAEVVQDQDGDELLEERRYIHPDHLGSSALVTNSAGEVIEDREFKPFGETATDFSTSLVSSGFTGHEQDPELGLINMRGRLYDPVLKRFITPDPFVAQPLDPQGLNRFSYVRNNPLRFVDPSGFELECTGGNEKLPPQCRWIPDTLNFNLPPPGVTPPVPNDAAGREPPESAKPPETPLGADPSPSVPPSPRPIPEGKPSGNPPAGPPPCPDGVCNGPRVVAGPDPDAVAASMRAGAPDENGNMLAAAGRQAEAPPGTFQQPALGNAGGSRGSGPGVGAGPSGPSTLLAGGQLGGCVWFMCANATLGVVVQSDLCDFDVNLAVNLGAGTAIVEVDAQAVGGFFEGVKTSRLTGFGDAAQISFGPFGGVGSLEGPIFSGSRVRGFDSLGGYKGYVGGLGYALSGPELSTSPQLEYGLGASVNLGDVLF